MRGGARIVTAALATALALGLAGCSAREDQIIETSGPVAFYPLPDGGLKEKVSGTIKLTEACLLLVQPSGKSVLPVFPGSQATWDGAKLTYRGSSYAAGDALELTGGAVPADQTGPMTYIPANCQRDSTFFVAPAAK